MSMFAGIESLDRWNFTTKFVVHKPSPQPHRGRIESIKMRLSTINFLDLFAGGLSVIEYF